MINLKKNSLSLVVATTLSLSGCGSSSSTNDTTPSNSQNPDTTQSSVLTGKAIDGYLEKALVCLDKNKNNDCDADEPISITNSVGEYSLEGITDEDKEKYAILVKAILGQTKDSDDNGTTIKNAFFLKAPASNADIVSPITTIVQNKIEKDPTLTVDAAIAETKKTLKVSDNIDILGNYITNATDSTENKEVYEQLHKVAEVIADSIGKSLDQSNMDFENSDFSDAGTIILDNLDDKLGAIMQASTTDKPVDSIITDLNTTKSVTGDEIIQIKEEKVLAEQISIANQKVTDSKDFENALKGDGLYAYWFNKWNDNVNFSLTTMKVNSENKLSWDWSILTFNGSLFVEDNPVENNQPSEISFYKGIDTIYTPTANGWESDTQEYTSSSDISKNESVIFNDDGSMVSEFEWGTYKTTVLSVVNLEGLAIKLMAGDTYWDYVDDNQSAKYYISDNSLFSTNTQMIKTKTEAVASERIMIYGESCWSNDASKINKEDMQCYDWSKNFYEYSGNYDNNLTFSSTNEYKDYFSKGGDHYFYAEQYKAQVDADGKVYLYDENSTQMPLTGELKFQTKNGASFYEIVIPKEYTWSYSNESSNENDNYGGSWDYSEILAVIDGQLRQGYWDKSSNWWVEKYYNKEAISDIKSALESGLKNSNLQ